MRRNKSKHGHTGGYGKSRVYSSWASMIQRTTNPRCAVYGHYGGRGITVCDRWRSFENFLADMGEPPEGMSIDRIDVNGNYEASNCRWATRHMQAVNRRNARLELHEYEQIRWLVSLGVQQNQVAAFFGVGTPSVNCIVHGRKAYRPRVAKLEPHEHEQVRWLVSLGIQQKDIAAFFGIGRPYTSYIINGRSRKTAANDLREQVQSEAA